MLVHLHKKAKRKSGEWKKNKYLCIFNFQFNSKESTSDLQTGRAFALEYIREIVNFHLNIHLIIWTPLPCFLLTFSTYCFKSVPSLLHAHWKVAAYLQRSYVTKIVISESLATTDHFQQFLFKGYATASIMKVGEKEAGNVYLIPLD